VIFDRIKPRADIGLIFRICSFLGYNRYTGKSCWTEVVAVSNAAFAAAF